jgi:hypothetical protein
MADTYLEGDGRAIGISKAESLGDFVIEWACSSQQSALSICLSTYVGSPIR